MGRRSLTFEPYFRIKSQKMNYAEGRTLMVKHFSLFLYRHPHDL